MKPRPGTTLAGTNALRQARITGGTTELRPGVFGLIAGTVVGPLQWDQSQEDGREMTHATVEYGALGVLMDDTANGDLVVVRTAGQGPVLVTGPALAGKQLCLDPAHPGTLHYDNTGTGQPLARALEDGGDGLVTSYFEHLPQTPPDASGA